MAAWREARAALAIADPPAEVNMAIEGTSDRVLVPTASLEAVDAR